jgi:hypothetical protein
MAAYSFACVHIVRIRYIRRECHIVILIFMTHHNFSMFCEVLAEPPS